MGKRALHATPRRVARRARTSLRGAAFGSVFSAWSTPLLLLCAACAGDAVPDFNSAAASNGCPNDLPSDLDCPGAAPSYGALIAGIVEQRCQGCHFPSNPFSSKVFGDYELLFAARRTASSQVYGCRMPPADAPQLLPSERAALLQWFVCGAPQN